MFSTSIGESYNNFTAVVRHLYNVIHVVFVYYLLCIDDSKTSLVTLLGYVKLIFSSTLEKEGKIIIVSNPLSSDSAQVLSQVQVRNIDLIMTFPILKNLFEHIFLFGTSF
ncbi:hypothetical protein BpHYR1_052327 [Brachionus plicatilis]|uniref:Uncharacterized protein n=1 Tax=Brachionus plicatilis TaxID=10195 RepID=A0A3M7T349_BRAPC|nr:hypothetical protein BpHYR1_052327 [Brachionus plicatilis]